MNYDAQKVTYQEVAIFDRPALFTECRIDRTTVPEGVYRYELRHGDEDWGEPRELARGLMVNFYGTVLTREPFQLPIDGWIPLESGSLSFQDGGCRTLAEFQEKYPASEKDVIDFYSVNEPALHALYFSRSEEQDKTVGCVGHLRGDFGSGKQFYTTWWPHQQDALNTPEFKADIDRTVNWLREQPDSPLRDFDSMKRYCNRYEQICAIKGALLPSCGFMVKTKQYVYMTSKSPVRSAEDVDEQALSYAEIKALASGNPMVKEKMDLDIEVSKLKLLKANHLSQKYALEDAISKGFPKQIAETQARIAGYGADIATVKENTHPNGDGFSPLTLAGVTHADKKEAGAALLTMCQTMLSPEATQIGSYRGLTLELSFDTFAREYRLTMIGQLRHTVTLGTDVFGNLQRMDNALEGLPIKEQTCREQLSNLQTQLEIAKVEVQKPFPRETELNTKTARLEELNSLLNLDHKESEIVDAEPDEDQRPPERRRPQLER